MLNRRISFLVLCTTLTLAAKDDSVEKFNYGNQKFSASVYKVLQQNIEGNFLFSPVSAQLILALAQVGSRGSTAQELQSALELSPNSKENLEAIQSIQPSLRRRKPYALYLANKIYVQKNFHLNSNFLDIAQRVFESSAEKINFKRTGEAAESINGWVAEHTNNKIKQLVNPQLLNGRTRTLLINALYFKGNWSRGFRVLASAKQHFYPSPNAVVEVTMMRETANRQYFESKELDAKFLRLPIGEGASMTLVLPNKKHGLKKLQEENLAAIFGLTDFEEEYVKVELPKFKINSELDFKAILNEMGVQSPFRDDLADLSGISGDPGELVIDHVIQKSFVDVTEHGVEAVAATYVAVGIPLSGFFPPEPKEFIADHPFIFYITVDNLVLFAGRVTDPSK